MAVLVRPTNVLLLPALLVLIGLQWRKLARLCAAGLPAAVWLGYYNNALYGGVLRSGYGQWQLAFSLGYFWPTALHFGRWLLLLLPGVLLFTPIAAVFRRGYLTRQMLALGLWFGTIAGLYSCYESHEEQLERLVSLFDNIVSDLRSQARNVAPIHSEPRDIPQPAFFSVSKYNMDQNDSSLVMRGDLLFFEGTYYYIITFAVFEWSPMYRNNVKVEDWVYDLDMDLRKFYSKCKFTERPG